MGSLRSVLARARREVDDGAADLDRLKSRAAGLEQANGELAVRVRDLSRRLASLESVPAIDALARLLRHAPLRTEPLVSVMLPTYDRPDRLPRAIDSVIAQRYQRWELVVVDDGSETDVGPVIEAAADPESASAAASTAASGPLATRHWPSPRASSSPTWTTIT